jgi:5-methylcytosine-specific restriction enzyme subunit McrC
MNPMSQELIELPEYTPIQVPRARISEELGEVIFRQYKNEVDIEFPSPKTDWQWGLVSKGWVGYIPLTPELGLYLSPKIPLKNLFGMLEYAYRLSSFRFLDGSAECSSLEEFYEQIAKMLAKSVLSRGRKGFYRTYDPKSERLSYLCGRLNLQEVSQHPWEVNLECHYEDFTSDIEDNQILAWTLHKILLTGMCTEGSLPIIRLAYRTVQSFTSLKPFESKACIRRLYNRLNQDYSGMHSLCRFFLENSGPKLEIGTHAMIPFLVNTARLFELFVAEWLIAHMPPEFSLNSQEIVTLDQEGTIELKVDLVLYDARNGVPLCVLDTKHKTPDLWSKNDDISQMVTYALAKKCSLAVLIYPARPAAPIDVRTRDGDIRVKSLTFDLNRDLDLAGNEFLRELRIFLGDRITVPQIETSFTPKPDAKIVSHIPGIPWDERSLFQELESHCSPQEVEAARKIFEWAKINLPRFTWGEGRRLGSLMPVLDYNDNQYWPIGLWTNGSIEIQFQWLKTRPPFDSKLKRKEFLDRLNEIQGINIPDTMKDYRPKIPLSKLTDEVKLNQFLGVLEWFIDVIKTR